MRKINSDQKKCTKCLFVLPIESFRKRSDRAVGIVSRCRKCENRICHDHPNYKINLEKAQIKYKRTDKYKLSVKKSNQTKSLYIQKWAREEYKANSFFREEVKERSRKYREKRGKSYVIERNLARYGLSYLQYEEIFKLQNGKCACCNQHQDNFKRRLAVDHCHNTGKVRGLLCGPCNVGIGMFGDSINKLEEAIKYLNNYLGVKNGKSEHNQYNKHLSLADQFRTEQL